MLNNSKCYWEAKGESSFLEYSVSKTKSSLGSVTFINNFTAYDITIKNGAGQIETGWINIIDIICFF